MRYTKKVPASKQANNFYKKTAARDAALQLIANLGTAKLGEVARIYRPMDDAWHAEVLARTKQYLEYAYQHCPRANDQYRLQAKSQKLETSATLEAIAQGQIPTAPAPTEAKKVLRSVAPRSLLGAEASTWVDLETGLRASKFRTPVHPVLEVHWMRARSLAVDRADSSAASQARRVLETLVAKKLLSVQRGTMGQRLYSVTKAGRAVLGPGYETLEPRSSMQSDHRTLANGYLLYALSDAMPGWRDAWSEGSMATSEVLPGVLGRIIALRNSAIYEGAIGVSRTDYSVHPADGVVLYKLNETGLTEDWTVELVEAERGKKQNTSFIRGLYPLRNIGDPKAVVPLSVNRKEGGTLVRNLRVTKITYVMGSDEFVNPLLRACSQFVTGLSPEKDGTWRKADTIRFEGTWDGTGDETQTKWEQLLSHIAVAFCPLSLVRRNFLGVSHRVSLRDLAEERGFLLHSRMLE